MARPDKAAAVAELTEEFRSSSAAVLTEYRGLTAAAGHLPRAWPAEDLAGRVDAP